MANLIGVERNILKLDNDPSSGAGTPAPLNTVAQNTLNGNLWSKTGALDTNWTKVALSVNSVRIVDGVYAVNAQSDNIVLADTSVAPVVINLPPVQEGLEFIIRDYVDASVNNITINPDGADAFLGPANVVVATITLVTAGAQRNIVGKAGQWVVLFNR